MKNAWLIKVLISSIDNPVITSCNFMAQWCMKKDTYLLLILLINMIILFILGSIKSSTQFTKKFTTSSWKKYPDLYYVKYCQTCICWCHISLILLTKCRFVVNVSESSNLSCFELESNYNLPFSFYNIECTTNFNLNFENSKYSIKKKCSRFWLNGNKL